MPREYSRHTLPKWHKDWQRPDYLYHMRPPTMPQNRFNIIFERFKTHDITDYRELAYFFGVAAAEEALLDEQAPPESDVAGNTVMTFAAACGRVKTIELLLRYGAKVDATNKCGNQPVHLACVGGSVEALRTLRYAGADLDARGLENHRSTPLHVACLHAGRLDVVEYLVDTAKVDVHLAQTDGATAVYIACQGGYLDYVRVLFAAGASLETPQNADATPFYVAAHQRHVDVMRYLVAEGGVDVLATTKVGQTALHQACRAGYADVFDVLFTEERGRTLGGPASIAVADESGATPLHLAAEHGHAKACVRLLDLGAEVNVGNGTGASPLYMACQEGHASVVAALLARGAGFFDGPVPPKAAWPPWSRENDDRAKVLDARGPVHVACQEGHGDVLTLLLDAGADAEAPGEKRATPVHYATENGHVGVVRLLARLRGPSLLRAASDDGSTPLHAAAARGHLELAKYLAVEGGADLEAVGPDGRTPLLVACHQGRDGVVAALAAAGANLKAADGAGRGAAAVAAGHPKVLRALQRAADDSNVALDAPVVCARCGKGPARKRCGKCRKVHYCSQLCQMGHWATHKHACGVVLAKAPPKAPRPPGDESESEEEDTRPRDMYGEIDRRPPEDTTRMIGV